MPGTRSLDETGPDGGLGLGKWLLALTALAVLSFVVRQTVFRVVGSSMEPTLSSGDVVVALRLLPWQEPPRGGVVVVAIPDGGGLAIKRVTAIPGDCVDVFGRTRSLASRNREEEFCVPLTEGHYFVLGDNRDSSTDSRSFGSVERESITARVALRIWSPISRVAASGRTIEDDGGSHE